MRSCATASPDGDVSAPARADPRRRRLAPGLLLQLFDTTKKRFSWLERHIGVAPGAQEEPMSVDVRPASLQDGVAVLSSWRTSATTRSRCVRQHVSPDDPRSPLPGAGGRGSGRSHRGVATLALRYQLGLGGLIASLDELAIAPGPPAGCRAEAAARDARQGPRARGGARDEAGEPAHAAAAGRAAPGRAAAIAAGAARA